MRLKNRLIGFSNKFLRGFYIAPSTIVTDGHPAIVLSIKKIIPSTNHYLCTWHISQNICSHMRPLLGSHFMDLLSNGGSYANVKTLIQLTPLTKNGMNY